MATTALAVAKEQGDGNPGDGGNRAEERTYDDAFAVLLQTAGRGCEAAGLCLQDQIAVQPPAKVGVGLDGQEKGVQMVRQLQ